MQGDYISLRLVYWMGCKSHLPNTLQSWINLWLSLSLRYAKVHRLFKP